MLTTVDQKKILVIFTNMTTVSFSLWMYIGFDDNWGRGGIITVEGVTKHPRSN